MSVAVRVAVSVAISTHRRDRWRGVARGAAGALAGRAVAALVTFVSVPLTIAYLGPERYGAWIAITSLLAWTSLADLGLANGFANALTRDAGQDRLDLVRTHIANFLVFFAGLAAVFAPAALLAVPRVDWSALLSLTSPAARAQIAPAISAALFIACLQLPLGLTPKILATYREGQLASAWSAAAGIGALMALLVLTHLKMLIPPSLPVLVIAVSGTAWLVSAASMVWLLTSHRPDLRPRRNHLNRAAIPPLLRSGGQFFLIQLLSLIVFETDTLVAGHYLGAASIPAYSLAYAVFAYTSLPQTLAFPYLWTAYTEAIARRDIAWVRAAFRVTYAAGLAFTTAATLTLVFIAAPFIHWWTGGAVTPEKNLTLWLAGWSLIHAATNPHACLLAAAGRLKAQTAYSAAAACCNIPLSIYLVPLWGLPGVIAGTVISYAVLIFAPIQLDSFLLLRRLSRAP
jgi:O-antigen/teichoic acid export membrane protein